MLRFAAKLLRFRIAYCLLFVFVPALLTLLVVFSYDSAPSRQPVSLWFGAVWLATALVSQSIIGDPAGSRVFRSLPLSRRTVGTVVWFSIVVPIPLFVGVGTCLFIWAGKTGLGKIGLPDVLLLVSVLTAITASAAFLFEIADLYAPHTDKTGLTGPLRLKSWRGTIPGLAALRVSWADKVARLSPLRMRVWHATILGLALPVGFLVHPVWRVADVDWLHVLMLAAGCCLFVLSFRWREHIWEDLLADKRENKKPSEAIQWPLALPSRRWSRIVEWNEHAYHAFVFIPVAYAIVLFSRYVGSLLTGSHPVSDLWADGRTVGFAVVFVFVVLFEAAGLKQRSALRVYRILPLTGRGLLLRFLYRYCVISALPVLLACALARAATGLTLVDVLLAAWAAFAVILAAFSFTFTLGDEAAGLRIMIFCFFFLAFLGGQSFLISLLKMHLLMGSVAILLTLAGLWIHYSIIARWSVAYHHRPKPVKII
jgi:MFS family permease